MSVSHRHFTRISSDTCQELATSSCIRLGFTAAGCVCQHPAGHLLVKSSALFTIRCSIILCMASRCQYQQQKESQTLLHFHHVFDQVLLSYTRHMSDTGNWSSNHQMERCSNGNLLSHALFCQAFRLTYNLLYILSYVGCHSLHRLCGSSHETVSCSLADMAQQGLLLQHVHGRCLTGCPS